MSILYCDRCADVIDTDEEPEAFVEARQEWNCYACRERRAIKQEAGVTP